jgi:hypothetical protein
MEATIYRFDFYPVTRFLQIFSGEKMFENKKRFLRQKWFQRFQRSNREQKQACHIYLYY